MSRLTENRIDSTELFRGEFLHAFRDTVELPDGELANREYVVHPGAVMIVPVFELANGHCDVVLERQFRYPLSRVMVEFPAGKIDPGETSLHCAQRELREETGYSATSWALAGTLHPVISYSTEFIDIWFAKGLSLGERSLDKGEFLDVFTTHSTQLLTWCREGAVTDAKTLVAALWLQNTLSDAWSLNWSETGS